MKKHLVKIGAKITAKFMFQSISRSAKMLMLVDRVVNEALEQVQPTILKGRGCVGSASCRTRETKSSLVC